MIASARFSLATCAWGALLALPSLAAHASGDDGFFEKRIRPVLVEHCQECHGKDKQKGGLRLDSLAASLAGGDLGPAIVPGEIGKSLLIEAITYKNEELQMPPKKRLTDAQVADLTEWVRRGAPWPGETATVTGRKEDGTMEFTAAQLAHWAFQPLRKPVVPSNRPSQVGSPATEPAHPIDAFLNEKLSPAHLSPSPPADAHTLLRRLTFDLTGLPPSPEEADLFSRECAALIPPSQGAFSWSSPPPARAVEQLIARLLASPHHGERFARHWLDVARYADSNGSEVDHAMANAWRYRDYVVQAFNADKPYDQFVREQIAGDLIPGAGTDGLAATGFLMLGPKALADLDKPKLATDIVDEQIDTLGRAFMGLTVGCARCHDHKFDPIGDEDYYALAGIFSSTKTMVDITKRVGTWTERPLGVVNDSARIGALTQRIATLQKQRDAAGAGTRLKPKLAAESAYLVIEAEDFTRGNLRVDADGLGRGIGVIRTRLEYPDHVEYEFEVATAGTYQLELRYAAKESRPTELLLNGNLEDMGAAAGITGDWNPRAQRWFLQGRYALRAGKNTLAFHRDGPVPLFDKLLIGRVSDTLHSRQVAAAPAARSNADGKGMQAARKKLDAEITAAQRELETIPTVMAPHDGPVADVPILVRGNPAMTGKTVARGFPRVIELPGTVKPGPMQSGRLELAQWLTRTEHPLTARVIVNRVWQWHFGEGLMRSPDNFGLRGEQPSHPELLDWLALWFMENGWSLKKLHTLICTSATYQRATMTKPTSADPENRLLSGYPRRRLSAEELRDAMLSVSGELDRTTGGSVMTVLNRTYAAGGNAAGDIVNQMHYDTMRRSLYVPVIRSALYDFFAVFDYPDPGMLTGQRAQTTVAPQALFLMNSPFVKARSAALARRVCAASASDLERLRTAYALVFGRSPTEGETKRALAFLELETSALPQDARKEAPIAAWARLCQTLLASNEFLYVR